MNFLEKVFGIIIFAIPMIGFLYLFNKLLEKDIEKKYNDFVSKCATNKLELIEFDENKKYTEGRGKIISLKGYCAYNSKEKRVSETIDRSYMERLIGKINGKYAIEHIPTYGANYNSFTNNKELQVYYKPIENKELKEIYIDGNKIEYEFVLMDVEFYKKNW